MRGVNVADMVDRVTVPDGMHWFDVAGQKVFPLYACSGSLCAGSVAILIDSSNPPKDAFDMGFEHVNDERGHWYPIKFAVVEDHHSVNRQVQESI